MAVSNEDHYEPVSALDAARHLGSPLEEGTNIDGRNNRQAAQCSHGEYAMLDRSTMQVSSSKTSFQGFSFYLNQQTNKKI